jgi:hypothetical protein
MGIDEMYGTPIEGSDTARSSLTSMSSPFSEYSAWIDPRILADSDGLGIEGASRS